MQYDGMGRGGNFKNSLNQNIYQESAYILILKLKEQSTYLYFFNIDCEWFLILPLKCTNFGEFKSTIVLLNFCLLPCIVLLYSRNRVQN